MPVEKVGLGGSPVIDPVCGMQVTPHLAEGAGLVSNDSGEKHYFCSESCKAQFDRTHQHQMESPALTPTPVSQDHVPKQYIQRRHSSKEDIQAHQGRTMTHVAPAAHQKRHGGQAHD